MSQLAALAWLKWRLFRNAMRSRRAAVSSAASTLGMLVVLAFAVAVAVGLGFAAHFLTSPGVAAASGGDGMAGYLFLLGIFAFMYLMWAIVPLGISGGSQFDPGRLLLYPVSLRKLFAIDLLSELTSLASIVAAPSVFALAMGAGLSNGNLALALLAGTAALAFGISFTKLLAASVGALTRQRRTRGETLLALLGLLFGFAAMFAGQLAPVWERHAESLRHLRWTPPGAVAVALTRGLRSGGALEYALALSVVAAYVFAFVAAAYWIARQTALGAGGARRAREKSKATETDGAYAGWQLPLLSTGLSAVVEKELRYAMRNAQLRMLAFIPLILLGLRAIRTDGAGTGGGGQSLPTQLGWLGLFFSEYGEGLLAATGVLYVFMILSAVTCNQFAFEGAGMRTLILSPLARRTILLGKNIAATFLAFLFAAVLLAANQLVFRDVTPRALVFAALCFVLFAALYALAGNWLSIYFPKRMRFGKKLNASGVTALVILPLVIALMLPPLSAVTLGYFARSLLVEYATLALFAASAVMLYAVLLNRQGRALARRELEILEAVSESSNDE
ncbi:MAG TPA: hypothetical protein VGB73_19430 [Pyrinomonadaceae bacterium]|jgi:hypothetical protein